MSQYKMQFKSPRGRRFCIDDKILALSLMKHSYKCFKHMSTLFALPSRKTLAVILGKVPFYCGLNEKIMNNLRGTVEKMEDINKHCVLLFDEISLKAGLALDKKTDSISGFENLGRYSSCAFADHALVFMARGIASKWKQPIAYFYSKHGVKSSALVHNIKDIIKSLNDIGLKVVATVCDQHATNQAAYKQLIDETNSYYLTNQLENRGFGFLVDGNEVVPLYDTPHLLKGIRNNMLDADVKFTFPGRNQQIASWNDIVNFYKYDQSLVKPCTATEFFERNQTSVFKLCHKLTDAHLYKEKMNKMKVSTAAQVFSHRVSAGMRCFKDRGHPAFPNTDTADFLLFVDQMFDSVNSSSIQVNNGKMIKCAIKEGSSHLDFWKLNIEILQSIKFIRKDGKEFVPPTIKNWIFNLRGFRYLWEKLSKNAFNFLCLRNFNQDPLENFFGSIRSHGIRIRRFNKYMKKKRSYQA